MLRTLILTASIVIIADHAMAKTVRYVFKGAMPQVEGVQIESFKFGLTKRQNDSIRRLTNNSIRFDDIFYFDAELSLKNEIEKLPGFSGVLYPNVPPPVMLTADPDLNSQWWIEKLRVKEAWKIATGKGIQIADCDAGYYTSEPDLFANLITEKRFDLSDLDHPDKVEDGNFVYHGTAVAAIMSGVLDQAGTNGIAYDSKIVPLQNFNYDGTLDDLDKEEATAKCILKALESPEIKIVVLENQTANGSSETFVGTRDAVRLALQSGVTIVSAGGNYYSELIEEAKDDTGSIIVGALAQTGGKISYSNFGSRITVSAFAEKLYTLYGPNKKMGSFGGTSGATPQVAATVALMLEINPNLTPADVKAILEKTRITGKETETVGGRLDTLAAVSEAKRFRSLGSWDRIRNFRAEIESILTGH